MADIVARLRRAAEQAGREWSYFDLVTAAADEIARLRTAVRMLGEIADACTFDELNEVCDYCRCGRATLALSSKA